MATTFVDRAATAALQVRPLKALLWVLTVPFYVLGWTFGVVWVVVAFAIGAVRVGITDARTRLEQRATTSDEGG